MAFQIITAVAAFFGALMGGIPGLLRILDWLENRKERTKRLEIRYGGEGAHLLHGRDVLCYVMVWAHNPSNAPRQVKGCFLRFGPPGQEKTVDAVGAELEEGLREGELSAWLPPSLLLVPFTLSSWGQRLGAACFLTKAADRDAFNTTSRGERQLTIIDHLKQAVTLRF